MSYIDKSKWPKNRAEAISRAKTILGLFRDVVGDESGEVQATIKALSATPDLTDEEIERIAQERVSPLADTDSGRLITNACREFYRDALRYARDNGYLSPAPPLSRQDHGGGARYPALQADV